MTKNIAQTLNFNDINSLTKKYYGLDSIQIKNYIKNLDSHKQTLLNIFSQSAEDLCSVLVHLSKPKSNLLIWKNITTFTECIGVSFWEIAFKTLDKISIQNIQDIYDNEHLTYIFEVINKSQFNKNNIEPIETFFKRDPNKVLVSNSIKNVLSKFKNLYLYENLYNDIYINKYKINFFYEGFFKIVHSLFDLNIWNEFINYSICSNIKEIRLLICEYKWVFSNITNINLEYFETILNERIELYKSKISFKSHSSNVLEHLNVYLTVCEINSSIIPHFINFFEKNVNKLVIIHGIEKYFDRLLLLPNCDSNLFNYTDDIGYHTLFDCLRYGNYNICKWYYERILNNYHDLYDGLYNVINTNLGLCYIFNNKDWRVLKLTLDVISTRLQINDIKGLDLSIVRTDTPMRDFTKKTKILLEFLAKYDVDHYIKYNSILPNLLYYESQVKDPSFQPFIISFINNINKNYNQQIYTLDIHHIVLHKKYINIDTLNVIVDLSNYRRQFLTEANKVKSGVYNFIINNIIDFDNREKVLCICKINKIVTNFAKYIFNLDFTLSEVFNFLKCSNKSQFYKYINKDSIFTYIQKINYKSKIHCNIDVDSKVLDILNVLLFNFEDTKNIGSYRNYLDKYINWGSEKEISNFGMIPLLKLLITNGFYFNEFKYTETYRSFYLNNSQDSLKMIFSSYYISNNQINEFKKFLRKSNFSLLTYYYNNRVLINSLKDIQWELKSNKSNYPNTILLKEVLCNDYVTFKYSLLNLNNTYSLGEKSKISILNNSIKKLQNEQVYKLETLTNTLIDFEKTYKINSKSKGKSSKKLDKLKIKLIEKIRIVIDSFKNVSKKYLEQIHFSKIIEGILNIKISVKNRTSTAFDAHYLKQKQFIKHICDKKNVKSEKKRQNFNLENTLKEIDELFSSDDEDLDKHDYLDKDKNVINYTKIEVPLNKSNIKITSPTLLSIKSLILNYKTHAIITQKIDGFTKKNISLNNTFPRCHLNNIFDVECIDICKTKVNFIIGINNSRLYDEKTFVDLIFELRNKHSFTKHTEFPRKIGLEHIQDNTLFSLIEKEQINFERYINIVNTNPLNRGKIVWWPKMFFELKYNNFTEYIELLSFFEKNTQFLGCFPNDGWILAHKNYLCNKDLNSERKIAFKIKPRILLTVDLLFKNNKWYYGTLNNMINIEQQTNFKIYKHDLIEYKDDQIYRCYPIFEETNSSAFETNITRKLVGYNPREFREDKTNPNSEDITNNIIYQTNNYFKFSEIKNLLLKAKSDYYHRGSNFDISNFKIKSHNFNYKAITSFASGSVIDLGGGNILKTNSYLQSISEKIENCVTVDNDVNLILENLSRETCNRELKLQVGFLDYTRSYNEYNKIENQLSIFNSINSKDKFDTILMMNSINFAIKSDYTLKIFMEYLEMLCKQNTKLIIKWMDMDLFVEKYNQLFNNKVNDKIISLTSPHDSSFINIDLKNKKNRIYYKWAHNNPIDEILIGKNELENILSKKNWNSINYEHNPNFKNNTKYTYTLEKLESNYLWDLYFKCFSIIVFEKC